MWERKKESAREKEKKCTMILQWWHTYNKNVISLITNILFVKKIILMRIKNTVCPGSSDPPEKKL